MPTYEYACSECNNQWEEMQRITAPPTEVCPKCGKPSAHRLISGGTNFILKGGGWYSDLYSSAKPSDKKAETTSTTSTETKTSSSETKTSSSEGGGTKTEGKAAAA
jgi:putative FmdB family regulatory protein